MIRKLITCLTACCALLVLTRCDEDEAAAPPPAGFTVDQTTGKANETKFTFVIDEVDADAITLYPYGIEKATFGTVPVSGFEGGKATVEFTYSQVGVFNAVVVSNNHNSDGTSVKNSVSSVVRTITITSDGNALTAFSLSYESFDDKGIKSVTLMDSLQLDTANHTFTVWMPYTVDQTKLIASFSTSAFSTVTVGGTEQESGTTVNNFTGPVQYVITSEDGTASPTYTVNVIKQAAEATTDIKSFSGKVTLNVDGEDVDRTIPAYTSSTSGIIVLYDTLGTSHNRFDNVKVAYELSGKFATMKYNGETLKQDTELDIDEPTKKTVTVVAQQPNTSTEYTIYGTDAPRLILILSDLVPEVRSTGDFDLNLHVLAQTDKEQPTNISILLPSGVSVDGVKVVSTDGDDVSTVNFLSGAVVDYSKGTKFEVTVTDTNFSPAIQYTVTYNVTWSEN